METKWAEIEVLRVVRLMLDGAIGYVQGCRIVVPLLVALPTDIARSSAATTLAAVDSETDTFPVAAEREQWDLEALRRADAELADYLEQVRQPLLDACRELEIALAAEPRSAN